jgi:hypothetical protein
MRAGWRLGLLLVPFALALPAPAKPDAPPDDRERNRRLLERWRADPDHYARLKRDLKAFCELPAEEQERLRKLDRELHEGDPRAQRRLWGVLERYAAWFDRLPEEEQRQIREAADRGERLRLIRKIRDRQFVDRLPAAERERVRQLPPEQQQAEVDRLRREERQRRLAWEEFVRKPPPAALPARPARLEEFPGEVKAYVQAVLRPQLSAEEREQLQKAEAEPWPALARTLPELSEKHPVALPGPPTGPRNYRELPEAVRALMTPQTLPQPQRRRLNSAIGRWPDFAEQFTLVARERGLTLPKQLGPCRPQEFAAPVARFLEKTLPAKLSEKEKAELKEAEGRWPDYPKRVLELARRHGLEVPLMRLPGPRDLWERARAG